MFELRGDHISFDLETIGTVPGDAIVSIGAVVFNSHGVTDLTFYKEISVADSMRAGFTINPQTLAWWMKQSAGARDALIGALEGGANVGETLDDFAQWVKKYAPVGVWSNGPAFDQAFLDVAAQKTGRKPPIWFRAARDVRTIVDLTQCPMPPSMGVAHNALDDAQFQAQWIINCHRILTAPMHIANGILNPAVFPMPVFEESEGGTHD